VKAVAIGSTVKQKPQNMHAHSVTSNEYDWARMLTARRRSIDIAICIKEVLDIDCRPRPIWVAPASMQVDTNQSNHDWLVLHFRQASSCVACESIELIAA
jgi:hypothetical protein